LQTKLLRGAAALSVMVSTGLAAPALAQTAQGQFTPDSNAPIQLHMPVHLHLLPKPKAVHRHKLKVSAPAAQAAMAAPPAHAAPVPSGSGATTEAPNVPAKITAAPARQAASRQTPAPSSAERRKAVKEVLAAPANATSSSNAVGEVSAPNAAIPFSFDTTAGPPPRNAKPEPHASNPARGKVAAQTATVKPKAANGTPRSHIETAALTPPKQTPVAAKPKGDPHAGFTKAGEILFDGTSTDPQADGASALKADADKLNAALDKGATNVQVEAYGGAPGDKSSEARRLSLRRALAVRQLLIDCGIPASRIIVKAMGGADTAANGQRVDVYLGGAS
jgi:outer membrane protein OmpA-like peptidoglycan-associated protein